MVRVLACFRAQWPSLILAVTQLEFRRCSLSGVTFGKGFADDRLRGLVYSHADHAPHYMDGMAARK